MARTRLSRARRTAARSRARRTSLADAETRREQHAQLVVARTGDARYPQREVVDGTTVVTMQGWQADMLHDSLDGLREQFRDQFGREPRPDDPLLWDPTAAEPTPLDEHGLDAILAELVTTAADHPEIGIDPAFIAAWRDVGYIVTEETLHLFSDEQVCAYERAVEAHQLVDAR